jgi:cytidylate kinase
MTSHESLEELRRLLRVRLEEWRLRERQSEQRPLPVVTISQEPGSGGEAIAQELCAKLGLHLYDWEVVERIAKDQDVSTQLVSALEQKPPGEFKEWLADLHAELQGEARFSSYAYVGGLKRALLAIAASGNAVVVGRGSNFFLPRNKRIGLCLVAPLALRVENTMKELGITEDAARERIAKREAEHRKLVRKYFQEDIRDPSHYDLAINTGVLARETIVSLVKVLIDAWTQERGRGAAGSSPADAGSSRATEASSAAERTEAAIHQPGERNI